MDGWNYADGNAKGLHALQWLCQESWKTYLKDGRHVKMSHISLAYTYSYFRYVVSYKF